MLSRSFSVTAGADMTAWWMLDIRSTTACVTGVRSLLAEKLGVSQSMVHRVWKANGLKPHLVKGFKASIDPHVKEKLRDVVELFRADRR